MQVHSLEIAYIKERLDGILWGLRIIFWPFSYVSQIEENNSGPERGSIYNFFPMVNFGT